MGVHQGSPICPLLFIIFLSSLHLDIPRSLIVSYVDDFAVTIALPSYRTHVCLLLKSFSSLKRKASPITISFSVPKIELIYWRTAWSNEPPCCLQVLLEGQLFYPQARLMWLGFIFTPSFDPRSHFSRRYTLAHTALATIRHLSPPGMGLPPHPLSLLGMFAPSPDSPLRVCCWEPPPSHHEPNVRLLASGL